MPTDDLADVPATTEPAGAPPVTGSDGSVRAEQWPAVTLGEPAHRVSPRAVAYWRVSALVGWVVFLAVLVTAWLLWLDHLAWPPYALGAVTAWSVVHVVVMPPLRYRVHRWEVTPVAVRTRSGWIGREQRIAPMSRVQTVDSTQGAIMRAFGVASVAVTTASAAGAITIEGLDSETAERLAAELSAVTAATPGDAT
ncbi:PH domain-containing protein [Cellulomonas carbonis]|uniref:Membrane protein n=1 Tax=Cellulomonas carbonis T26 TaxID=947969 RepID=A0A0A0BTE2_9CELL|nr:PH domain-containing protein [Cellulomonas carbonis]KGM10962.1 membrane protein [Cellulomonas carbonis T26]GGC02479.1 membrane protein [Cellulomonas carbonis]